MHYQKQLDKKDLSGQICPLIKPEDQQAVKEQLSGICLFVTSTFGNGDPPRTGESLAEWIDVQLTKKDSKHVSRLSVDHDAIDIDQTGNIMRSGKTYNRRMNSVAANRKFLGDLRLANINKKLICIR